MKCQHIFVFSNALILVLIGNFAPVNSQRVCSLPSMAGNCLAYFPSYYYDEAAGQCKEFVYGGCGGNENRFPTLRECRKIQRLCLRGRRSPPLPPRF